MEIVTFSEPSGSPDVLVVVGNAQYATYELVLWKSDGTSIDIGANDGKSKLHRFSLLKGVADLRGRRLVWTGLLRPIAAGANQAYSVRLDFFQNGQLVQTANAVEVAGNFGSDVKKLTDLVCEFA